MHGFDLFVFSEIWITSSIFNESILLPGYSTPLRKDRIGKRGGGVALYVRDNTVVKRPVDLEPSNQLEVVWAQCNVKNCTILCAVCYRPPNQPADDGQQSGTVIKFDNRVTSQDGASSEFGEFSESIQLFR